MPVARLIKDQTFTNAVVHVTGTAYTGCQFHNCTFVFNGFPIGMNSCGFHGAHTWKIDFTVHDPDQWDEFVAVIADLITKTLPKQPKDS